MFNAELINELKVLLSVGLKASLLKEKTYI